MRMFLDSQWVDRPEQIEVRSPFSGEVIDTVPSASPADVSAALSGLERGRQTMRRLSAFDRSKILRRAADLMLARQETLAKLISSEEGKILAEARLEAGRSQSVIELSSEEARRIEGEVLPLDAAPGGAGRLGFTLRVPCGIVAAITPFNFPLNLVAHKVGPALAAGNAVLVKPASDTPLSALALVEILLEAGLPPEAIACVTGPGAALSEAICADPRVRKISFTGSREVGERICQQAGLKRVTMELGSNSPLIVLPDADLDLVARASASTCYANAGQVCISAQRVLVSDAIYDDFLSALAPRVEAISVGNPLDEHTGMGPMIRPGEATRVAGWIEEAVSRGARIVCGGTAKGNFVEPTVVADVDPEARLSRDELFGPAVALTRVSSLERAIELANDTRYGLSAALFTRDLNAALRFARDVESGNLHINWGPQWRADLMPYGGLKDSGFGKEGPRYAIDEMTESKTVVVHGI